MSHVWYTLRQSSIFWYMTDEAEISFSRLPFLSAVGKLPSKALESSLSSYFAHSWVEKRRTPTLNFDWNPNSMVPITVNILNSYFKSNISKKGNRVFRNHILLYNQHVQYIIVTNTCIFTSACTQFHQRKHHFSSMKF